MSDAIRDTAPTDGMAQPRMPGSPINVLKPEGRGKAEIPKQPPSHLSNLIVGGVGSSGPDHCAGIKPRSPDRDAPAIPAREESPHRPESEAAPDHPGGDEYRPREIPAIRTPERAETTSRVTAKKKGVYTK